jgi:hypothetical protein
VQLREAYLVLGVSPGIDQEEIRSRYRGLVKELHPDVSGGHDEELGRIIEAYRVIDMEIRKRGGGRLRARPRTRAATTATATRPTSAPPRPRPRAHAEPHEQPRRAAYRDAPAPAEGDARDVFALGRVAVTAGDRTARCRAIQRLAETRLRSAGVFIRQCLFDTDPVISVQAARSFPLVPGNRMESVLIELFDQLTAPQCEAILDTIGRQRLSMRRFLAYAAADARPSIRRRAMEVLRGT